MHFSQYSTRFCLLFHSLTMALIFFSPPFPPSCLAAPLGNTIPGSNARIIRFPGIRILWKTWHTHKHSLSVPRLRHKDGVFSQRLSQTPRHSFAHCPALSFSPPTPECARGCAHLSAHSSSALRHVSLSLSHPRLLSYYLPPPPPIPVPA